MTFDKPVVYTFLAPVVLSLFLASAFDAKQVNQSISIDQSAKKKEETKRKNGSSTYKRAAFEQTPTDGARHTIEFVSFMC